MRGEMRGKYLSCSVSYKMNIWLGRVGGGGGGGRGENSAGRS